MSLPLQRDPLQRDPLRRDPLQRDPLRRRDLRRRLRKRHAAVGVALVMVVGAAGWSDTAAQTGPPDGLSDDAAEIPEDAPEDTPGETPEDTPEERPDDAADMSEDAPEDTPGDALEVCAAARRLEGGRFETAVQRRADGGPCGERLLPRRRILPADAPAGRWLVTAPLEIDGVAVRVAARRRASGHLEVALQIRSAQDGPWSVRLLPSHRFVAPADAAGRWLSSSPVDVLAAARAPILESAQLVTYYGFPGVRGMGILGRGSPQQVADQAAAMAAAHDRLNGDRGAIPAFHLVTGVAQAYPTADGTWISRLAGDRIAEYVELARELGMHVFLDEQIGWSDPLTEVKKLEPFLREPFVHVAIDPEFATKRNDVRPGLAIGSVTGAEINEVQRYLAEIVRAEGLPPKILMVHQFTPYMVSDRSEVADVPEVDLSIDMDGFGGIGVKLRHYRLFALPEPSERPALKIFFNYDTPVMTPQQVQGLDSPPDIIVYQ